MRSRDQLRDTCRMKAVVEQRSSGLSRAAMESSRSPLHALPLPCIAKRCNTYAKGKCNMQGLAGSTCQTPDHHVSKPSFAAAVAIAPKKAGVDSRRFSSLSTWRGIRI